MKNKPQQNYLFQLFWVTVKKKKKSPEQIGIPRRSSPAKETSPALLQIQFVTHDESLPVPFQLIHASYGSKIYKATTLIEDLHQWFLNCGTRDRGDSEVREQNAEFYRSFQIYPTIKYH